MLPLVERSRALKRHPTENLSASRHGEEKPTSPGSTFFDPLLFTDPQRFCTGTP